MIRTTTSRIARLALLLPFIAACSDIDSRAPGSMEGEDPNGPSASGGTAPLGNAAIRGNGGAANEGAPTGNAAAGNAATSGDDEADEDEAAAANPSNPPSSGSGGNATGGAGATVTPGAGPPPVLLRSAGNYVILAQSAISNVPSSRVTGDLGISPAAASAITGFPLARQGVLLTAPEVIGDIFAADSDAPTPSELTSAISDMQAAYDDAAGRPTPAFLELGDGAIGGLTLVPGLYKWTSVVTIPSDVTLSGSAKDVWIFQISGDLTMSSGQQMNLTGGAHAENIIWQVAGAVDLGTSSHAEGIMLSKTAIHLGAGASINGRLLAQTAVTLSMATVTEPTR